MKERMHKKKDGFVWIMDLKLRRKLKGKQEKNNGCCQVVDLHLYRKKKIGVCIWIIRDIPWERLEKRWGWLYCGFENK